MFSFGNEATSYTVGEGAFYESLSRIYIGTNLPIYIKDYAFYKSELYSIDLDKCAEIGDSAFVGCDLSTMSHKVINASSIGQNAFGQSTLNSIGISENVNDIGPSAFSNGYLNDTDGLPTIINRLYFDKGYNGDTYALFFIGYDLESPNRTCINYCKIACQFPFSYSANGVAFTHIKELVITSDLTKIDSNIFYNCIIDSPCVLPDTIESIGDSAFSACKVDSVIINSKVSSIGDRAFAYCNTNYIDFSEHTFIPSLTNNSFDKIVSTCKIVVPDSLYDEWIVAQYWSYYASHIIKKSDWDAQQVAE